MPVRPPRLQAELDRMAARNYEAEHEARRASRRDLLRVSVQCIGSCVFGLVIMAFGLHTDDEVIGKIFWWGGMTLGYAGIFTALHMGYRRGEERGDW
jgi:hypothetical protein